MGLNRPLGPVQRFAAYAARVGFHHSRCDSSLFIYRQGADTAYLLLYVDDIVLTASSFNLLHQIITSLYAEFSMTDLGSLNYFLGIYVTRNASRMFLSQQKYATKVLDQAGMLNCKPCRTPVDTDSKLFADGAPISEFTLYRSPAGALQYLTFTRPDISYAVQQWLAQMRIGLVVPLLVDQPLVIMFFLATIFSPGHRSANLLSLDLVLRLSIEVLPMRFLKFVGYDLVATGAIRVLHVPSRYQYGDIFTKGLPTSLFDEFRTSLSFRSSLVQTAGEC
ncbi:ribonuclease H-like domain-containing protein [Tanacetum coccineum]